VKRRFFRKFFGAAGLGVLLCVLWCETALAILIPEAANTVSYEDRGIFIDASHSSQGYVMIRRKSDRAQVIRISLGRASLTYQLNTGGAFEVFPLQMGDGEYKVEAFEQISGRKYRPVSAVAFPADLVSEVMPFLYPNQYVSYDESAKAVAKARELCQDADSDAEKVEAVYQYVLGHMKYDTAFARETLAGGNQGYLPSVDETLRKETGVCFDFSALIACMLRSEGIATQLVIGYADKSYHAWNQVFLDGEWRRYDVTVEICAVKIKRYTPERYY
jgi:transglutaminase-like putative cysteine protease